MILEIIFRGFFSGNQMEEDHLLVEINDKIHFSNYFNYHKPLILSQIH